MQVYFFWSWSEPVNSVAHARDYSTSGRKCTFLKCVVGLTITLDCSLTFLLCCDVSLLVCSLPSRVLSQVSKGRTHLTFSVLEPLMHLPCVVVAVTPLLPTETSYLPLCETTVKEISYDPLLGLLHWTVWGLIETSYWGDPLTCWQVQQCQQLLRHVSISRILSWY